MVFNFWHKREMYNFDPYNVFLVIATNIPQRLKTAFVLQGHIYICEVIRKHQIASMLRKGEKSITVSDTESMFCLWLVMCFFVPL